MFNSKQIYSYLKKVKLFNYVVKKCLQACLKMLSTKCV